jgi:cyclic pyranopterin phosphate synthase
MPSFSHLDSKGQLSMVDVSEKDVTSREAVAGGEIRMNPDVIEQIKAWKIAKGNVLETARLAGIMAAKKVDQLIPLCHSVPLEGIGVDFDVKQDRILIRATVRCSGKTGVEMEALTAATVAGLTIYDMCKAVDRGMRIDGIRLLEKKGGKSGHWQSPA